MKKCNQCAVIRTSPDFYVRRLPNTRIGVNSICIACSKINALKWAKDNRQRHSANTRAWWLSNKETHRKSVAKWDKANHKKRVADAKRWAAANPEKVVAKRAKHRAAHPERGNAYKARRKAKKLFATPKWANHFFIEEIYDLAKRRTKATGYKWHVDHIVPLQSPLVCGLHVEYNLRVIPAVENLRKHNRLWPDMPT